MHSKAPTFRLTIPSRIEELEAVRTLVGRASEAYALSEDMTYWMELTITECMINAIRHGNASTLSVSVTVGDDLLIEVVDNGGGICG